MPDTAPRRTGPFAVVTGASSGIGYELARCCARRGYDLVIAADEPQIEIAAQQLRGEGAEVTAVLADLSTPDGVGQVCAALGGRRVDVLCANAGRGLGHAFLDQDFADIQRVVETNVTGTLHLLHRVGRIMRAQGEGRILITGSISGFVPGTCNAAYNASKAFLDSFSYALRHELQHSGVSVTCLMPGCDRHGILRARGPARYRARPAEEGRSRRGGPDRPGCHDARRGRGRTRLAQQAARRARHGDAGGRAGRTAPPHGRAAGGPGKHASGADGRPAGAIALPPGCQPMRVVPPVLSRPWPGPPLPVSMPPP